ncbi:hypothetical protein A2U01_0061529, partial [Trifolium medium]|nr:hypothetical protein [Trifolium medium]
GWRMWGFAGMGMEKENFPRWGMGTEMGSILDGGELNGKVLPHSRPVLLTSLG